MPKDQLWLNSYPLVRNRVFDYFAVSVLRLDLQQRTAPDAVYSPTWKMTGIEYMLSEVMEPYLLVIRKEKRDSLEKVTPMLSYYLLDGSIHQAPLLCNIFAARIMSFSSLLSSGRALNYIQKAFTTAASKLEKIGYVDAENEGATLESKVTKETINFKEVKRVDHILASL